MEHPLTAQLLETLRAFDQASPALLERRALLQRSDAKFLASARAVTATLERLRDSYTVLPAGGHSIATYQNLYFDTPALRCYHDHRCGRRVRQKVRIRNYPERQMAYLEVKTRRNELLTDKHRMAMQYGATAIDEPGLEFLGRHCLYSAELEPTLEIDYQRVSLIGISTEERVTVDYHMVARRWPGTGGDLELGLEQLAIIEVKQPALDLSSPVMRVVRGQGLKLCSFSKYSIATALGGSVPCNSFKPTLRALERISS